MVVRGDEVVVIVPVKRDASGNRVLGLPKGHIDPGESSGDGTARQSFGERGSGVRRLGPALGERPGAGLLSFVRV